MDVLMYTLGKLDSALRYSKSFIYKGNASSSPNVCCQTRAVDAFGFRAGSSCSALIRLAGISGALAVGFAAYSSHAIQQNKEIDDRLKRALKNGNKQHFIHTIALLLSYKARFPALTASFFTAGLVLFCGPCYAHGLWSESRFQNVTPIGGLLFIAGWLSFVF